MIERTLSHVGLTLTLNGIEYNYNSIPDVVTLFPSYIDKEDSYSILNSLELNNQKSNQNILNCISKEIKQSLIENNLIKSNTQIVNQTINEITNKKGIYPIQHTTLYHPILCIVNIGRAGPITLKNNKTNAKYTFTLDNGMMMVINDKNYEYIRNVSYMSLNMNVEIKEDNRYILTFYLHS